MWFEGVIRKAMQKTSLTLSENITGLAVVEMGMYLETFPRLVRGFVELQSKE